MRWCFIQPNQYPVLVFLFLRVFFQLAFVITVVILYYVLDPTENYRLQFLLD